MPSYYEQRGHPDSIALAKKYGELMLAGKLTNKEFGEFVDPFYEDDFGRRLVGWDAKNINKDPTIVRFAFIPVYGFFVATTEWIEQIAGILKDRQPILEVCAGTGALAKIMQQHLEWIATDIDPPNDSVETLGAIEAIEKHKPATVFASWIDLYYELDCTIAKRGLPFMIVGENQGCTGSDLFWRTYKPQHITDVHPGFIDAVSWFGIHDTTWLVNWS